MAEAVALALVDILLNVSETVFGTARLALYDLFGIRHRQCPPQFLFDIVVSGPSLLRRSARTHNIYPVTQYCSGGDPTDYIRNHGSVETLEYVPASIAAPQYYPPLARPVVLTPIARRRHPTFPSAHLGMASPHPRSPRACSTSHPRPVQRLVRRVGDGPRYDRRATQAGGEHDVRGQTSRSRSWPSARSKLCARAPPAATRPVAERAAETDQQGHRCGRFLLHVC
jgi:hypothetical protein